MLPLISIIVPAYNLETHIKNTLECIISQDYNNIELVLVDDASYDNTLLIVQEVLTSTNIKHIIIKHETNLGVSAARNSGMRAANGEFLLFWDGDDLADNNFISILFKAISSKSGKCDLAFCGYRNREEENGMEQPISPSIATGKTPQQITALRILNKIVPSLCTFLYRKTYLCEINLNFYDGCTAGEDVEFVIKSLVRCRQLAFSPLTPYVYLLHKQMGSRKNSDLGKIQIIHYEHNTEAHSRTADYLQLYAKDNKLKNIVNFLLIPQIYLRKMTLFAGENDRIGFDAMRSDPEIRYRICHSYRSFLQNPDVFLKSLYLLFLPNLFYKHYNNKYFE